MKTYRFDIIPKKEISHKLEKELNIFFKKSKLRMFTSKIYWIQSKTTIETCDLQYIANEILSDSLIEDAYYTKSKINYNYDQFIEISFKPGVRDNRAQSTLDAIKIIYHDIDIEVHCGDGLFIQGDLPLKELNEFSSQYLCNPLLHNSNIYLKHTFENDRFDYIRPKHIQLEKSAVEVFDLEKKDEDLNSLSESRCLALSLNEMHQIRKYISKEKHNRKEKGLAEITDVEIEILAQTWSEHCKHKIFSSKIEYSEESHKGKQFGDININSLYKEYIRHSTNKLSKEKLWLRSVFSDNAGVVRFDSKFDLCIKVETHNSPCALDPYGGALTGILGVNRDIMGTGLGAMTIANMDVFCTGFPQKDYKLPPKLMPPKRILSEVHKGVEDGGNKSGIPTINGSMHFHDNWVGKPLIYVGSVGILPHEFDKNPQSPISKNQKPGDLIVVCGGRVGADGIHGATFSSMELKDDALSTFVQIGDPYTQKKLADFILEARDKNLFTSITDNGAGGLSSSIGEMAQETGGAKIYLERALLKYPGLKSYEIMISESQERMTLSVDPSMFNELKKLSKKYEVEIVNMGEFTNNGYLEIYDEDTLCAYLDINFMHNGLDQMKLKAKFAPEIFKLSPWCETNKLKFRDDLNYLVQHILSHPNIASKESWVRQYDHEVKAQTVGKPYNGINQDSPSDAGIIDLSAHGGSSLISISNGLDTLHSMEDSYISTHYAVDEAIRNLIASGADINHIALLDNFCWPDPIKSMKNPDGEHKLAMLVRSNIALKEACLTYKTPLISGKDSMKNDFYGNDHNGNKIKISSPPTLLVTGMAKNHLIIKNQFQEINELIYLIGNIEDQIHKSHLTELFDIPHEGHHPYNLESNKMIYEKFSTLHPYLTSAHDISEGGLFTTLFEMNLGNNIGCEITAKLSLGKLFNEPLGSFVVTIKERDMKTFEEKLQKTPFTLLGKTTEESKINIFKQNLNQTELIKSYKGAFHG